MLRVLHFSDVHVHVPLWRMPPLAMLNKRLLGAANLVLRRKKYFDDAPRKLGELASFGQACGVDLAICTGDYTALGTPAEHQAARAAIDPLTRFPLGFATVPGNHDVYMPDTLRDRRFERHFGDLLSTDLPQHARADGWPRIRLVGEHVAVVSVNSARPNPQPWRSSGRIPDDQLEALPEVLSDPALSGRFVFVVTHYAPRRHDGTPDLKSHGLDNAEEFLAACAGLDNGAILHGHIHRRFHLQLPGSAPPIFGAGSATQAGGEGIWLFELDAGEGEKGRAVPGSYAEGGYRLDESAAVSLGPR